MFWGFRSLADVIACAVLQLEVERLKSTRYAEELRQAKEQSIALHKQVELEQECITLKLMKRLEQLKREKQNLANEVGEVSGLENCQCTSWSLLTCSFYRLNEKRSI